MFPSDQIEEINKQLEKQEKKINVRERIDTKLPLDEFIKKVNTRNKNRIKGEPIGYKLDTFKNFENAFDGLQNGFILISAHPNVGKTALSVNLSLDAVKSNPNAKVLLFTLDDTKETIIYRLNTVISNNNDRNANIKINDNKKPLENPIVNASYEKLIKLYDENRFDLIDDSILETANSIRTIIEYHYKQNKNLIVFIDGLFKLPTDKTEVRMQNEERAERIKNISKEFSIPIIATGELKKAVEKASIIRPQERDIPESRKYSYEADAIMLLYRSLGTYKDDETEIPDECSLTLCISKNKLSEKKGDLYHKFYRSKSKIEEIIKLDIVNTKSKNYRPKNKDTNLSFFKEISYE